MRVLVVATEVFDFRNKTRSVFLSGQTALGIIR